MPDAPVAAGAGTGERRIWRVEARRGNRTGVFDLGELDPGGGLPDVPDHIDDRGRGQWLLLAALD